MKITQLDIRGLNYHVQEWGDASNPTLVLLHGWMDCGGSYKFIAEHLSEKYHLVAPDLRGFGNTDHAPGYWFADYFADLSEILDYYVPNGQVDIVGHSMGGNIVMMFAGIQPQRIGRVLSLEALGMPATQADDAPNKYRRWMREILSGEPSKVYPNEQMLRHSIRKGNPALSEEMVTELLGLWGEVIDDSGAMRLKHDHAHRYANPVRYNFDDVMAIWREVTAKVGIVMADNSSMFHSFEKMGRIDEAKQALNVRDEDYFVVENSAHMLHLEQPEATAKVIDTFFS